MNSINCNYIYQNMAFTSTPSKNMFKYFVSLSIIMAQILAVMHNNA